MRFETASASNALIMNGKGAHVLNPWRITIDLTEKTITIRKRNKSMFGVDEQVVTFKSVRNIKIDEHFVGADIHIKVLGGTASAYCLSKEDAKKIKQMLLDIN
ncbi:MAG: hypothetical protein ACOVQG_04335 [Crocinitomicaceae bacterium]|jgi:hypothetical protein